MQRTVTSLLLSTAFGTLICLSTSATNVRAQEAALTDSQVDEILEIRRNANEEFVENAERLRRAEEELNVLMASPNASEEEIQAKYEEIRELSELIADSEFQARLEIRRILPPDLREPFARALQQALEQAYSDRILELQTE